MRALTHPGPLLLCMLTVATVSCTKQTIPIPASALDDPAPIISYLLRHADIPVAGHRECDVHVPAGHDRAAYTLADDIAHHLAEMNGGTNTTTAECWPPENGLRTCTVMLRHDSGKIVWARGYRFSLAAGHRAQLKDLQCFTIP